MSMAQKQGIVTILSSDSKTATSLRRTLSADMSSRKWLSQHGMKKIASSEELSNCLLQVNAGPFDIWSSIVSQKGAEEDKSSYIHPLVKRSGSCLSDKSLEVCTESLGSETGSDGFSSSEEHHHALDNCEDVRVAKYNFAKKSPPPSFPPPLPSLTSRPSSLRMMPRRENGRLVLEAVSVSAPNNFRAERQDGRLVLSLLREAQVNPQIEKADEEEDQQIEIIAPSMSSGVMKIHRLALTMNRPASLLTPWPHKYNESLPPQAGRLTAEASVNAYDYSWRAKPTAAQAMEKKSGNKYIISKNNCTNIYYNFKGCKDHRRSLFREPYCITTT